MTRVFISYRRDDSGGHTGRLVDTLERRFDRSAFFRDIDSIGAGVDYRVALNEALSECSAVLVMIGPEWATTANEAGPRLKQEDDLVRIEVATALAREGIHTYPVLVGGATMPDDTELPDDLKPLTRRQALEISDTRWDYDVHRLGDTLIKDLRWKESRKRLQWSAKLATGVATLIALILGVRYLPGLIETPSDVPDNARVQEPASGAGAADPEVLRIGSTTLRNLNKTSNQGEGFDYWPDGGIRIAYFHLKTFTSYPDLASLSPVPVFLSGPHDAQSLNLEASSSFGHYNPEFLDWARIQIDAVLADSGLVSSTRSLFQQYLGATLRTYWDTIRVLREHPAEFAALVDDYRERVEQKKLPADYYYNAAWNGREYLESIRTLDEMHDINVVAPAVYFWVRRELDGTRQKMTQILGDVLLKFGVISSAEVSKAEDNVDFDSINMFDDPDSMRRIRDRLDKGSPNAK